MRTVYRHAAQLLRGVGDLRRVRAVGEGLERVAQIRYAVGRVHDQLLGLLLAQIGKLLQHLLGGLEIQRRLVIGVLKALLVEDDLPIDPILRLQKVDVSRCNNGLVQLLAQGHDPAVEIP